MKKSHSLINAENSSRYIIHENIPKMMMVISLICCVMGIIIMAVTSNYIVMGVFISIIAVMCVTVPLRKAGKISVEAACIAPMLILCFVYTPISWITFDGLLGCTPYLTILFSVIIILTYYSKRTQTLLLGIYSAQNIILTISWLISNARQSSTNHNLQTLIAYFLTSSLTLSFLLKVKKKNAEINMDIIDRSFKDVLTGLYNRQVIETIIELAEKSYNAKNQDYAAIMLDIDSFKHLNDNFGHSVGDNALKELADCLQNQLSVKDYAVRFGGDEFIVISTQTNKEEVDKLYSNIKKAIDEIKVQDIPVGVSVGFALRSECMSKAELIIMADRRMYDMKRHSDIAVNI